MAWDEAQRDGVDLSVAIVSWRGTQPGINGLKKGRERFRDRPETLLRPRQFPLEKESARIQRGHHLHELFLLIQSGHSGGATGYAQAHHGGAGLRLRRAGDEC
jgi:hypothetical protein